MIAACTLSAVGWLVCTVSKPRLDSTTELAGENRFFRYKVEFAIRDSLIKALDRNVPETVTTQTGPPTDYIYVFVNPAELRQVEWIVRRFDRAAVRDVVEFD